MDITGARWGLTGAEAILKLRALHAGDFDQYWAYHLSKEQQRIHMERYSLAAQLNSLQESRTHLETRVANPRPPTAIAEGACRAGRRCQASVTHFLSKAHRGRL
jgi:hypothetical protein